MLFRDIPFDVGVTSAQADMAIKILRNVGGLTIETNRLSAGDGGNLRRTQFGRASLGLSPALSRSRNLRTPRPLTLLRQSIELETRMFILRVVFFFSYPSQRDEFARSGS